jgi:hypothetical protein
MRFAAGSLVVILAALLCLGKVELVEDPPPIEKPKPGHVTGTIEPASRVSRLAAVSRGTLKTYSVKSLDKNTGRFLFADLPGDASYDLRVSTTDGGTVEGIDLSWMEARMVRLAALRRKQLGLPPERERPFTLEDVSDLLKWVEDWKDFMEIKRVLYVQGHGPRATMLVELMRTREFHAAAGAIVWRVELWYMKNEFGAWDRIANSERVLHRERIKPEAWRKIDLTYYPELSVYVDPEGKSKPVHFKLPAKGDLSRGRLANTEPEVKAAPHVRGLDVKPDKPAPHVILDG